MYSAVRHQGKHLYELARQGIEVERHAREIEVKRLDLLDWYPGEFPKASFDIECSKGTYVRTICQDLGQALNCGAHMSGLVRHRSGPFKLEKSISLQEIESKVLEGDYSFLIPFNEVLDLPRVFLGPQRALAFRNGLSTSENQVQNAGNLEEGLDVQVFAEDKFIGIGTWREQALYPHKVF
jgi:tRNA pseudouridine55 synthase